MNITGMALMILGGVMTAVGQVMTIVTTAVNTSQKTTERFLEDNYSPTKVSEDEEDED